ncbi:hypothetical protein F442_13273, partial [Phytophthora nicotianae P10297]
LDKEEQSIVKVQPTLNTVAQGQLGPQPQQFQVIYILDKVLGLVVGGALSKTTTAAGLP